jgi:uncharacterized protein (UPF0332 family)
MAKAAQAAASARVLLDAGDADGACNRAYYAMFDAARAALMASGVPLPHQVARTHNGLITAFSQHFVKNGRVGMDRGRSLNKVEDLRLLADYRGDPLELADATWAVEQANLFVDEIRALVFPG